MSASLKQCRLHTHQKKKKKEQIQQSLPIGDLGEKHAGVNRTGLVTFLKKIQNTPGRTSKAGVEVGMKQAW